MGCAEHFPRKTCSGGTDMSMARPREEAMNFAALPLWFIYLLVFALFGVAPAVSPLLGPDEVDAAGVTAQVSSDRVQEFAAINNPACVAFKE